MATTKRPSRGPPHSHPGQGSIRPRRKTPPPDWRIAGCEAQLDNLRVEVEALRGELHRVKTELASVIRRMRKHPPPLPEHRAEEIITVDEGEIVLETVRPPRSKR
jgi:hypothetical protein